MPNTVFVSGAGGFAGHHFLEHVLVNTDWDVVATDSFRHKGKTARIYEVLDHDPIARAKASDYLKFEWNWFARTQVFTHDLCAPFTAQQIRKLQSFQVDYMVCFASESHVDRSISDPVSFINNNTQVALNTLELARRLRPKQLIWISTDEVYGPVGERDLHGHKEWAPILPSNPYSASKAAQEAIAISYWRTYGVPLVLVNCMNLIGERQDVEKFVPMVISRVLRGETVTIHGTEKHIGSRHYLHARNLADALLFLLREHTPTMFPAHLYTAAAATVPNTHLSGDRPDRYNVASSDRIDNLTLARAIAYTLGSNSLKYKLEDFHSSRPGHDPHYALDGSKLHELGWRMPVGFDESLERTVKWTAQHRDWLMSD